MQNGVTSMVLDIMTRIIPEDWVKEKGKKKHPKFIDIRGKKLRR